MDQRGERERDGVEREMCSKINSVTKHLFERILASSCLFSGRKREGEGGWGSFSWYVYTTRDFIVCMCACVRVCVRACVRVCVHVHGCVYKCMLIVYVCFQSWEITLHTTHTTLLCKLMVTLLREVFCSLVRG